MIEKSYAIEIKKRALSAVSELSNIVSAGSDRCSVDDFEKIKKGVGVCIGRIQMSILEEIYRDHPDLDDLR
jgi:hypothetical protein